MDQTLRSTRGSGARVLAAGAAGTLAVGLLAALVVGLAVNQSILLVDAALERRRAHAEGRLTPGRVLRSALDRSGMIMMVTLTTIASLIPLAIGTSSSSLFGAIALATAGGTVAGTLGALLVLPAMLAGRRRRVKKTVLADLSASPAT